MFKRETHTPLAQVKAQLPLTGEAKPSVAGGKVEASLDPGSYIDARLGRGVRRCRNITNNHFCTQV